MLIQRQVYLVGETVPQSINDRWAFQKRLYNMYGPTEATCGATIKRLYAGLPITVGHPNPTTRVYVLDRNRRLLPPGVIGELYLAGVQIAKGYVGRAEETRDRYLPDILHGHRDERMYKTGDRGYWTSEGEIALVGRNDRQVKMRGFRLDLDDLEILISRAVTETTAVALVVDDGRLVVALQPEFIDTVTAASRIASSLPSYAVPKLIKTMKRFPLTAAGKTDYTAISAKVRLEKKDSSERLETPTELIIAEIWKEILGLGSENRISRESNFVMLGGHSVSQLQLSNRLTAAFKRKMQLRTIMDNPVLGDLSAAIDQILLQKVASPAISASLPLQQRRTSPIEQEWWTKYNTAWGSSAFNVSMVYRFDPNNIDRSRLRSAWNLVLARHPILGSRYIRDAQDGELRREISSKPLRARRIKRLNVKKEINFPFRLNGDDLVRVLISKACMVICISHIICDLTTLKVLLRETASAYNNESLPPIRKTYETTTHWDHPTIHPHIYAYWRESLRAAPEIRIGEKPLLRRETWNGASLGWKLDTSTFQKLQTLTSTCGFTFHQVALATVALAVQIERDDTDIILGSPYFNREAEEDLDVVGLFLEPLAVRLRYCPQPPDADDANGDDAAVVAAAHPPMRAFIQAVKEASQLALAHRIPWTQLLREMEIMPEFPSHPLIDVMVSFHDERQKPMLPLETFEPLLTWTDGAKFNVMCEFCAVSDACLLLRIEYADELLAPEDVRRLEGLISEALKCLVSDASYETAKARLREMARGDNGLALDGQKRSTELQFGTPLSSL